ncbi:hypothetical protein [Flavobacterium sp.]|uniref:hypothetical protein n=1 Tax=Flavobacterium sp. TaxID=239 RepID=UPI0039E6FEAB
MKNTLTVFLLLLQTVVFAQQLPEKVNDQKRYKSDNRMFYVWNEGRDAYDLRDTEFENSVIDIREIGSRSNGYILLALTDDGNVRTYHGSIIQFNIDDEGNSTWVLRSKNARGKLVLDPKKKTLTYSYESNEKRYVKIFVFHITDDDDERDN